MIRCSAALSMIVLTIMVSAVYLPMLYEKVFFTPIEKTHLLFSPVTQRFIYQEKIVGPAPPEAVLKAEDHHAEIAYRDADGTYYNRIGFEKNLPFIYYKNMEFWGLMPLEIGGRLFDAKSIKENRRVLEFKPGEIHDHRPQTPVWPLLESNPGQVRLVFPEDRFRMTDDEMQFVNADINKVDQALSERFTGALKAEGFVFPARSVNGKFTILKPFDEGAFIVDADYRVFHVKRYNGQPLVVRTPIDPALKTRHIKVSENNLMEDYGFLLTEGGSLYLLTYDNYGLIQLPLDHYDPDSMDFKFLTNPIYLTAVWSDESVVRLVVMDRDYRVLDSYTHTMSRTLVTPAKQIYEALFPFTIRLSDKGGGFLRLTVKPPGMLSLIGIFGCLIVYVVLYRFFRGCMPPVSRLCLVALSGVYGLVAALLIGAEE